jgi:hypothetical protein
MAHDPADDLRALCDTLETLLAGSGRAEIVGRVVRGGRLDVALRRLRSSMSEHGFEGLPVDFADRVRRLDQRTRRDGFRVLHSWDHGAHRFTDDLVPVLMVGYFERAVGDNPDTRTAVAILLDYYLLHLLALAAMRAWDAEDPGGALDRVTHLLALLQGPEGSGHHFVTDAETLLIYALSQFHPEEQAYDRVIERVAGLPMSHQVAFARVSAAVLGTHLRWGFWLMYERDIARMREDNVGDYPWLLYTVTTLLRAWADLGDDPDREDERRALAGSLLLGLAADPWAFGGAPPPALRPFAEMYAECRSLLEAHGAELVEELARHEPAKDAYAPLSLHFNFPHNALVAILTVALVEGRPQPLALDDLFDEGGDLEAKEALALALTDFSRSSPERLGYRGALLVGYDPLTALRSYATAVNTLRRGLGSG